MEINPEDLKGMLAVKVFNPAAKCQAEEYEWKVIDIVEVEGDKVIYAVEDGEDEMHLEDMNRHMIVDFLEVSHD